MQINSFSVFLINFNSLFINIKNRIIIFFKFGVWIVSWSLFKLTITMGGTCTTPESDKKVTLITSKSSGGNKKQAKSGGVKKYKEFQSLGSLYDECTSDGRNIQWVVTIITDWN